MAMNIGLLSLGLVSCGINQQPSPPQIEKPTLNSEPSPAQTGQNEDEDDKQDDGGDDQEQDTKEENED